MMSKITAVTEDDWEWPFGRYGRMLVCSGGICMDGGLGVIDINQLWKQI